jgi:hypothetical protein
MPNLGAMALRGELVGREASYAGESERGRPSDACGYGFADQTEGSEAHISGKFPLHILILSSVCAAKPAASVPVPVCAHVMDAVGLVSVSAFGCGWVGDFSWAICLRFGNYLGDANRAGNSGSTSTFNFPNYDWQPQKSAIDRFSPI